MTPSGIAPVLVRRAVRLIGKSEVDEWLKLAQTAVTTAAGLVALFFLEPGKYLGIQSVRFSVASKKRKKLDALIRYGQWKAVSAIELELAVRDAC